MTTPSETKRKTWSLRRIGVGSVGLAATLVGVGGGLAAFLTPRPRINQFYVSHQGSIWLENTNLAIWFFIGGVGMAIFLDALFGEPERKRFVTKLSADPRVRH